MKKMTTNEVVYDYQAPSVELTEVAVEKGFAATGGPNEGDGGNPDDMPFA